MKKLIITTIALAAIATSTFAQGFVTITAGLNAATRMSTNSAVGGASTGLAGSSPGLYYYALFASSSQTTVGGTQTTGISGTNGVYVFNSLGGGTPSSGWELVGLGTNSSAGRVVNSSQGTNSQAALNGDSSMSVTGINGGNNANLVVVAWYSVGIGSTLQSLISWYNNGNPATTGWIGQSGVASGILGDGSVNGVFDPFGVSAGQVPGILVGQVSVPEPGTLALAAIGSASLLLFRRRK